MSNFNRHYKVFAGCCFFGSMLFGLFWFLVNQAIQFFIACINGGWFGWLIGTVVFTTCYIESKPFVDKYLNNDV